MENMNKSITIIILGLVVALFSIFVGKEITKPKASFAKNATVADGPAVYLFLNEKDQDSGCRRIYTLYENAKKALPPYVKMGRLDVSGDRTLFKKFDVRILPAILFIGKSGVVRHRIEGEGDDVEAKLKAAFLSPNVFLNN